MLRETFYIFMKKYIFVAIAKLFVLQECTSGSIIDGNYK